MTLTPTLASIEELYRKLERESHRAYHARKRLHKADHFFNFCVTAHSLRDYFFERKGITTKGDKAPYHQLWDGYPALVAAGDIANTSKHFTLRFPDGTLRPRRTRRVRMVRHYFADVFASSSGEVRTVLVKAPDVTVTLSDGTRLELYQFMAEVLDYWRFYLRSQSIVIRRQSLRQLIAQTDH